MISTRRILVLAALVFATGLPVAAQISGSIYSSTRNGSVVNGNVYGSKSAVYLSGGPSVNGGCSSTGLPDGRYYFQLTTPSGSQLLSQDPITNREVIVSGGVITAHTGTHRTGRGNCGSVTVQLMPYVDTTNAGREYKLWLTPTGKYDPMLTGFFGFQAPDSKTDNYKIKAKGRAVDQTIIRGQKFFDRNQNGIFDGAAANEAPIAGWRIELRLGGLLNGIAFTDDQGYYCFIRDLDNTTYSVVEIAPSPGFIPAPGGRWLPVTPVQGTVVTSSANVAGPNFGNISFTQAVGVGRTKGFWHSTQAPPLLVQCDPQWRTEVNLLCLYSGNGVPFTVPTNTGFQTAFDALSNFLVGNPALGHGGFILGSQVAASVLNNECGFMQGTIYVDRLLDDVLVSFDKMVSDAKQLLCDPNAGLTGPNDPYQALRNAMLACANEFENINDTGDPEEEQVVFSISSTPEEFESPYGPLLP